MAASLAVATTPAPLHLVAPHCLRCSGRSEGVLLAASLAWCLLLLAFHLAGGFYRCSGDYTVCAYDARKNGTYAGVLTSTTGRTLPLARFFVAFGSRGGRRPLVGPFTARSDGHYCIVWAHERTEPDAIVDGSGGEIARLGAWRSGPVPPGCQRSSAGVPRLGSDDVMSSTPFRLILALGAISVMLASSAALRRRPRLIAASGAATVAFSAVVAVVWF